MMEKKYKESRGLPGGPNEMFTYVTGVFSTNGYKRDSPDVNKPFNLIDSGNITMEGVDFPVIGTDNLGNQKTMMPGGNYQFPGNQVFEMPMAQNGTETTDDPPPWIRDYKFTQADIDFLNNDEQYCPGGQCLEQAYKAYDKITGGRRDFPTSTQTKTDLGLQSASDYELGFPYYNDEGVLMRTDPNRTANDFGEDAVIPVSDATANWIKSVPYFDAERNDFTADSWDIHGIMVDKGGKNLFTRGLPIRDRNGQYAYDRDDMVKFPNKSITDFSESELKDLYSKIPIGAIIGFDSYDEKVSFNRDKGLTPSGHSTIVVGFDERGVPVVYDYGNYTAIDKGPPSDGSYRTEGTLEEMKYISNITYPPDAEGKTHGWLIEQGMFDTHPEQLDLNYDALETELYKKGDREALTKFHNSLVTNKAELMNLLDISNKDYDMMSGVLLAQTMQESSGGKSFEDKYVPNFVLEGMGETQGLTQLNINNILDDEMLAPIAENFFITEEADLFDPAKAAIASMIFGKRNLKAGRENYKKGKGQKGVRTFYPRSDIRETAGMNVNITFNGYEFKTEEGPIVDFVTGNSFLGWDKDMEDIQAEFDKIAPGKYKVREEEVDVDFMSTLNPTSDNSMVDWAFGKSIYVVDKITEGNKGTNEGEGDLTDEEIFAYNWQSPNALRSGDARGDSEYAKNVLRVYNKLREENPKKRMGGQIGKNKVSSVDKKVYKAYFDKKIDGKKAKNIYDKLNRVYYKDSKAKNMSPSNYILTHVIT